MKHIVIALALFLLLVSPVFAEGPGGGAVLCSPVGQVGQGGYGCYTWPAGYRQTNCADGVYTWTGSMWDASCIGHYWDSTWTW